MSNTPNTPKMIVKLTTIDAFIHAMRTKYPEMEQHWMNEYHGFPSIEDYPQEEGDSLTYYVSEAQDSTLEEANSPKFSIIRPADHDESYIEYDPTQINWGITRPSSSLVDLYESLTDQIFDEYDGDAPEDSNIWAELGLSGDDDVDYNGSYLTVITSCFQFYLEHSQHWDLIPCEQHDYEMVDSGGDAESGPETHFVCRRCDKHHTQFGM